MAVGCPAVKEKRLLNALAAPRHKPQATQDDPRHKPQATQDDPRHKPQAFAASDFAGTSK
ncbi:hypothetical protein BRADI_2g61305v3 [Brachypodium distachyon]|uniref:Uncharacterized protein n=1 Tax=Brachypodium distachyon TaxID=15368 RepID=A0A2K2DH73_BRADI|nr:hypothetical protein BRADI_2g61305v3 [Brachypodium distachyon]